jgi:hypothetical protein
MPSRHACLVPRFPVPRSTCFHGPMSLCRSNPPSSHYSWHCRLHVSMFPCYRVHLSPGIHGPPSLIANDSPTPWFPGFLGSRFPGPQVHVSTWLPKGRGGKRKLTRQAHPLPGPQVCQCNTELTGESVGSSSCLGASDSGAGGPVVDQARRQTWHTVYL